MRGFLAALALVTGAAPAWAEADFVKVRADASVAEVMNRLVVAVEGAGALVFARVDHAGAAQTVGQDLPDMELLIFGNPTLGTPAIRDAPMAGLMLPLRVLAYEDADGAVWLSYQDVGDMLEDAGGDADADYVAPIAGALERLTAQAAGG
ncbi:DUF302 domain-containing protein [Psychromarinibacter halotolerans]|uniref:DUF302 domain-containing protein n=1 Tax=Psychromarinibacter halotolerans TaxID=1775175 RepID=A0ABV7GZ47_9RHOB|nr:DUF302 domain-containing protein [Psychromarinibacter halotolerans]MDF0598052.1 DUF302 domain-containing protein [Psychromarinibacter halotolerans]